MYIVIEGQDSTGKSTQVRLLQEYYEKQGKRVVAMDEPDGDLPQAHDLHDLILIKGKDYQMEPLTNVLLFTAARSELWRKIIEPTLKSGGIVISARNWWSTLAYQGYGEGVSKSKIIRITHESLPIRYVKPSHGFILTVSDKVREERHKNRGKPKETFESKPDDFQQRVNHAYLKIAQDYNIKTIDASGTVDEVFEKIIDYLRSA